MTTKRSVILSQRLEIQYPIMLKEMTDDETKEYHLKRLERLALSHIGDIPQLDKPTYEQEQWVKRRMNDPQWAWNHQ